MVYVHSVVHSCYTLTQLNFLQCSRNSSIVTFPVCSCLMFLFIISQKALGSLDPFYFRSAANVCLYTCTTLHLFIIVLYSFPINLSNFKFSFLLLSLYCLLALLNAFLLSWQTALNQSLYLLVFVAFILADFLVFSILHFLALFKSKSLKLATKSLTFSLVATPTFVDITFNKVLPSYY